MVGIPALWRSNHPVRPTVSAGVGGRPPSLVRQDALFDFMAVGDVGSRSLSSACRPPSRISARSSRWGRTWHGFHEAMRLLACASGDGTGAGAGLGGGYCRSEANGVAIGRNSRN